MNAAPPLGQSLAGWSTPPRPARTAIEGAYTRLEPLEPAIHAASLFEAYSADPAGATWTYLPEGPFTDPGVFNTWLDSKAASPDPMFFAVRNLAGNTVHGILSFLRMKPQAGSIEVGYITFAPAMQRTIASSEAVILLARSAFQLGYRRFEWKCNALNIASRRAAQRYGFSYEGTFRQHMVVKERNRDTAWFAMIDTEFSALDAAYSTWLDPTNFDAGGAQIRRLSDLTRPILANTDPGLD